MPPLLTLVLFLWAWATIDSYVLKPMENVIGRAIILVSINSHVFTQIPDDANPRNVKVLDRQGEPVPVGEVMAAAGNVQRIPTAAKFYSWNITSFEHDGEVFVPTTDHKWISETVFEVVKRNPGKLIFAGATSNDIFERYVRITWLPRRYTIPVFLFIFVSLLYLLGRFLAAGVGRIFVLSVEGLINKLPVVRNVYSSVKQVTDFIFTERAIEFNRVVAVQYPRKGVWSIGFVTGESMLDIRSAANEPVLSVLMPTSPMPATGFTITVRKSETIDLDITIDQAIQFIVSCGVVVPLQQQTQETSGKISQAIARRLQGEAVESEDSPTSVRRATEQPRRASGEAPSNGDGLDGDPHPERGTHSTDTPAAGGSDEGVGE
jgi:uncharacterized membrane protein